MAVWDAVVVGAGGSGAPLARTLADFGMRVLLLEAGPAPSVAPAPDAHSLAAALPGHPLAATFPANLTDERAHLVVRGRGLGGSTATNGCYFRRARGHDLERWARRSGDARWAPASVAKAWAEIETDHDFGENPGHGRHGPIQVTRGEVTHPVAAMLLSAAHDVGLADEPDKNADAGPGVGMTPMNALGGIRSDAHRAFLQDSPPTLTIWTSTTVQELLWERHEIGRVAGVRVVREGVVIEVSAGEVILSAGALASAALLQISGIGPTRVLRAADVQVRHDLPVGLGFSDHPNVALDYRIAGPLLARDGGPALGVSAHASSGVRDGGASDTVDGDIEVLSFHRPLGRMLGTDPGSSTLTLLCSTLVSAGGGELSIVKASVAYPPRLHFHYRESATEKDRLRAAVRLGAGLLTSAAAQEAGVQPVGWNSVIAEDDNAVEAWIDARLSTALHTCGTTPMGPPNDPRAVVDGQGRVHGVAGLRVADTGILPDTPTGGPSATAALIGVIIARAIASSSPGH